MVLRLIYAALTVAAMLGNTAESPAVAAERGVCLSRDERRTLPTDQHVIPLGRAMRLVKTKVLGEVLRARLCRRDGGKRLVYVLTVLARNGKVVQARVDAGDGHWLGAS